MSHKPTYHFTDNREIEADGIWIEDHEDVTSLVAELVDLMPSQVEWQVDRSSVWRTISDRWHGDFVGLLQERNADRLTVALSKLHSLTVLKGIDQSRDESVRFRDRPDARRRFLVEIKSLLARLAESLGVLRLEVDPRYRPPENIYLPVSEIVETIRARVGIDPSPPPIGNDRFGLRTGPDTIVTNRDLYALYLACRCRELALRHESGKDARILEIGGGMGRMAYYLHKLGHSNVTLVDLPQIAFVQAYFLRRSLGPIVRYGKEASLQAGGIQVVAGGLEELADHSDRHFDIVVNSDSMPEMGWTIARRYIAIIREMAGALFLSANQESRKPIGDGGDTHAVVAALIDQAGGFHRLYRFPFWLRNGYAEELYAVQQPASERGPSRGLL